MRQNLVERRINLGLSVEQAAEKIGCAPMTYRRAEQGGPMPRPAIAKAIADLLGFERVTEIWPLDPEPTEAAA